MNLRDPRVEEPVELNLVSLVDVVFTLLLFFVLTTTFQNRADITLDLPRADSGTPPQSSDNIDITVDARGRYYVQGQALVNERQETLERALQEAIRGVERPLVVISADAQSPHQAVVTAMDAARRSGIARLTIATSPQQRPAGQGAAVDGPIP